MFKGKLKTSAANTRVAASTKRAWEVVSDCDLNITLGRVEALLQLLLNGCWEPSHLSAYYETVCVMHDLVLEAQQQASSDNMALLSR